jgi:HK97 family phage major capsid protein
MDDTIHELEESIATKMGRLQELTAIGEDKLTDEQESELVDLTAELTELKATLEAKQARRNALEAAANLADDLAKEAPKKPVTPDARPGKAVIEKVEDGRLKDPLCGFKHPGEYYGAIMRAARGVIDSRLNIAAAITGMGTVSGPDGGFATVPVIATDIWNRMMIDGMQNPLASTDQRTLGSGERDITLLADAETSRATGSRHGGIRGYRKEEGGTLTASKIQYRELNIKPTKLTALAYMTSELMEQNAINIAGDLSMKAGDELNWIANNELFNGGGGAEMIGIVGHNATVSVAKETGQAATTIKAENLDKMWSRCHPRARSNAVWYINIDCEPQLQKLERQVGAAGVPAYMPAGGLSAAPYGTLKGRPVVPIEWCQTLGTVGDIVLADLSYYLTVTRGALRADSSIHVAYLTDQSVFRFILYINGQPWNASALTPANGTGTLSPFVTLATRS